MSIDLERVRRETPGCAYRVHLNNAGASLMPEAVSDAVLGHLRRESEIGGYEARAEAEGRVAAVYGSVARLIGAGPGEVALLENATRAWEAVFYSLHLRAGDRIITGRAEYGSNFLAYLQVARRTGAEIVVTPNDAYGQVDVAALRELVDDRTRLVGLTHVPTSGGLVNPAEEVGRVARAAGVPFLLDACQSAGQMPLDVDAIGCDFLSATGRKFLRGPRGTGFLYVRESSLPLLDPWVAEVRSAEWTATDDFAFVPGAQRFETWENSYANQLGLGAAVDYALDLGLNAIWERTHALGEVLRARLDALPGVHTHDLGARRCGIVTFTVDRYPAAEVAHRLAARGINVSVTTPANTRLDSEDRGLPPTVRVSAHYYNTEDEVDQTVALVESLATSAE